MINNSFILIVTFITVAVSFWLFRKATGTMELTRLNWLSFNFYYGFLLISLIGTVLFALELESGMRISTLIDLNERIIAWGSIVYGMVALPLGILFVYRVMKTRSNFSKFSLEPLKPLRAGTDRSIRSALYILSFICILAVFYSILTSGGMAMLSSAFQSSRSTAVVRSEIGWHYSGVAFIRQIFGIMLTPLLSYIAFAYWHLTGRHSCFIWWLIMTFFSLVMLVFTLAKAAVPTYILGYLFLWVLMKGRVKKSIFVATVFFVAMSLIGMYYYTYRDQDIMSAFSLDNPNSSIITRLLYNQIEGYYYSLFIFPDLQDHQGLLSQSGLYTSLFGGEQETPYTLLITQLYSKSSVTSLATSIYPAEAWAIWGWEGLIISPWLIGMAMGLISTMMFRLPKSPVHVGVYAYLSYKLAISSGFVLFIYSPELIKTLMILYIFVALGKFLSPSEIAWPSLNKPRYAPRF